MWWELILFCMIADGPTSTKCDLTLMTSVTLRLQLEHYITSYIGSFFQVTSVRDAPRHVFRINRNLDI